MFFVKPYDTDCYEFDTIEEAVNCVWKKLSKEEQKEIADNYLVYPDNKEYYSFGEYMVDHWEKYFSDYIDFVEENEDRFVMGVPSYAICYLIYGEPDGLNDEDIENIDQWIVSMEKPVTVAILTLIPLADVKNISAITRRLGFPAM